MDKTLNGKKLSFEDLLGMKYLDMVVSETLRYWPSLPIIDRACIRDYKYNDGENEFTFEKGMVFWIAIYAVHHDEKNYPNPSKFDPERFSDENKTEIVPGTYLPFGSGPRNCIGSRLALMQIKYVVYQLLLNFKFELNGNTEVPIKLAKQAFTLEAENEIHLTLIPRYN